MATTELPTLAGRPLSRRERGRAERAERSVQRRAAREQVNEAAEDIASDSFFHGVAEGSVLDKLSALRLRRKNGGPGFWRTVGSMATSMGVGGAVRVGFALATGGGSELVSAMAGGTAAVVMMGVRKDLKRREYEDGSQEGSRHRLGRVLGEFAVGAALGFAVAEVMSFTGAADAAANGIKEGAHWLHEHIPDLLDGPEGGVLEPPSVELPGTPEAPQVPSELVAHLDNASFDGSYDPNTGFFNSTGYDAIAAELQQAYAAQAGGGSFDGQMFHTPEYHFFVERVLADNGLDWDAAKDLNPGDPLTIRADTLQTYLTDLNATTGGEFKLSDFIAPHETPGVEGIGGGPEVVPQELVHETSVEVSKYLNDLAGQGDSGRAMLEAIARGEVVPGTPAFEIFQQGLIEHINAHDSSLNGELLAYELQHEGAANTLIDSILDQYQVTDDFQAFMGANPIGETNPSDYVSRFIDQSQFRVIPDQVQDMMRQQLEAMARQQFELAGAST